MMGKSGTDASWVWREQVVLGDLVEARGAEQAHGSVDLASEDLEDMGDAGLPGDGEAPELRTPDEAAASAQCERLHDIAAAAHAAIHQDRNASIDSMYDARQRLDRRHRPIELPASMVGDDDGVD